MSTDKKTYMIYISSGGIYVYKLIFFCVFYIIQKTEKVLKNFERYTVYN